MAKHFNAMGHLHGGVILILRPESFSLFLSHLRACLHGGGGPQVGEITRLGEVKK